MTQEAFTLADSASGANSFYVDCKVQSQKVAFCACLNRHETIKENEGHADWASCKTAANQRECKALEMRQEEIIAGRAIYFIPRQAVATSGAKIPEGYFNKDTPASKRIATKKPTGMLDALGSVASSETYAAAVAVVAKTPAPAPAPIKTQPPKAAVTTPAAIVGAKPRPAAPILAIAPGESLIDFMARMRESAKSAVETI